MTAKPGGLTLALSAGVPLTLEIEGRYLACTDAAAPFAVQFDGEADAPMEKGITLEDADGYSSVTFISPTTQTVQLVRSRGQVFDSRVGGTVTATTTISDDQVQQIRRPVLETQAQNAVQAAMQAALLAQGVEVAEISAGAQASLTDALATALTRQDVQDALRATLTAAIGDAQPIQTTT